MFETILHYSAFVSLVINLLMLVVWIAYLQLFFAGYRRQHRSSILIMRGGPDDDAHCLVVNMGDEQIYVTSLIGEFTTKEDTDQFTLVDMRDLTRTGEEGEEPAPGRIDGSLFQGILASGEHFDLGRFDAILKAMRRRDRDESDRSRIDSFQLTVVALYGAEHLPVGAVRRFSFPRIDDARYRIAPDTIQTRQLRSGRARRKLLEMLRERL